MPAISLGLALVSALVLGMVSPTSLSEVIMVGFASALAVVGLFHAIFLGVVMVETGVAKVCCTSLCFTGSWLTEAWNSSPV